MDEDKNVREMWKGGHSPDPDPAPKWAIFLAWLFLTMLIVLGVLLFVVALLRILRWL